jgi:excisionase family DNA binding protein
MTYPAYIREKARGLRREKKLTIDELAERLAISRMTIYYWVRDLPIPTSGSGGGFSETARRKGNRAMRRKYRQMREVAYEEGLSTFVWFDGDPLFRDFICMYIAEGHKKNRNRVSIGNSDPAVMALAQEWMERFSARDLDYGLQYHADQDPEALARFWAGVLAISPERVKLQRKSNSAGLAARNWRSKYGVLSISSNDTCFRAELQAWMDCVRGDWL